MIKKVIILSLCGFAFLGTNIANVYAPSEASKSNDEIAELWGKTVNPYLKYMLWQERDIYDAGHFLMVPLHYAYESNNDEFIRAFENHFDEFIESGINQVDIYDIKLRLSTLHYYYLISRYIVLASNSESDEVNKENVDYLAHYLLDNIKKIWTETPAWQWDRDPFQYGMRERILWKINNKNVTNSYYRAIIDEELFTLAIASDLSNYFRDEPIIQDILEVNYLVFQSEGQFDENNRWLFQPGVWNDHPDYLFAGYDSKDNIKDKKPIANISNDSSHFHRFPLWIKSFINAYPKESKQRELFLKIQDGLEKQFFDKVLIEPDGNVTYYRLNNFMDGNNGIFRWNYETSKGDGYGPYELTGTFTIGWWTFLGTDRIKKVYNDLYKQFPLSEEAIKLYVGPNTTRQRNPFVLDPDSYYNGYKELLALLSSKVE